MKILIINKNSDKKFNNLVSEPFSKIKDDIRVGFATSELSNKEISEFSPDIVIHNCNVIDHDKSLNIFIKTNQNLVSRGSQFNFDISDIKPFITLHNKNFYDERYSCDLSYIGRSSNVLKIAKMASDKNLCFKVFGVNDIKISNFCSSRFNICKTFKMSKISLVNNIHDAYECIYNDGKPFIPKVDNRSDYYLPSFNELSELLTSSDIKEDKRSLINSHTNFDRISEIIKKSDLKVLSNKILSYKKELVK